MDRTAGEIVIHSVPYATLAEHQYAGMVRLIDERGLCQWHFSRSAASASVTVAGEEVRNVFPSSEGE